ncbi:MAG: carboxypeptidase regulatory-like domain-containing protein [Planctomycetota bacterium]|nr:MAG: carboxypeptidase regulatory-like domain-containing protein [Planctomycetota bacterium]
MSRFWPLILLLLLALLGIWWWPGSAKVSPTDSPEKSQKSEVEDSIEALESEPDLPAEIPAAVAGENGRKVLEPEPDRNEGRLKIRVVDDQGTAIEGAVVGAMPLASTTMNVRDLMPMSEVMAGRKPLQVPGQQSTTDASGWAELSFQRQDPQAWYLFARAEGHSLQSRPWAWKVWQEQWNAGEFRLKPAAALSIRLLNQERKPLAAGVVQIAQDRLGPTEHLPVQIGHSDQEGWVHFQHLAATKWVVRGFHPKYQSLDLEQAVNLKAGDRLRRELVLQPGHRLVGLVHHPDGHPAPGLEIEAAKASGTFAMNFLALNPRIWTNQSDARGRFLFEGLPQTKIRLRTTLANGLEVETFATPGPVLDWVLPQMEALRGTVQQASGKPAAGALVMALRDRVPCGQSHCDANGSFVLDAPKDFSHLLIFHDSGEAVFENPKTELQAMEFQLPQGAEILIQVQSELAETAKTFQFTELEPEHRRLTSLDAQALASALLAGPETEEERRLNWLRMYRPPPQPAGFHRWRWPGIRPGAFRLQVRWQGRESKPIHELVLTQGKNQEVIHLLTLPADLTVQVVEADGQPAGSGYLSLLAVDRPGFPSVQAIRQGKVRFTGLEPGPYQLFEGMQAVRSSADPSEPLLLQPGENLETFVLPERAFLELQVIDRHGGAIPNPVIEFQPLNDLGYLNTFLNMANDHRFEGDAVGRWQSPKVPPGRYALTVARSGGFSLAQEIQMQPGLNSLKVRLQGFLLAGSVQGARGPGRIRLLAESVPSRGESPGDEKIATGDLHRLLAIGLEGQSAPTGSAEVAWDAQGRFQIRDLAPGRYALEAKAEGHYQIEESWVQIVDRDVQDAVVQVALGGELEIRLQEPVPEPGFVRILSPQGETIEGGVYRGRDQSWQNFAGLPPGIYQVELWLEEPGAGQAIDQRAVEIQAGETQRLHLAFPQSP